MKRLRELLWVGLAVALMTTVALHLTTDADEPGPSTASMRGPRAPARLEVVVCHLRDLEVGGLRIGMTRGEAFARCGPPDRCSGLLMSWSEQSATFDLDTDTVRELTGKSIRVSGQAVVRSTELKALFSRAYKTTCTGNCNLVVTTEGKRITFVRLRALVLPRSLADTVEVTVDVDPIPVHLQ